MLIPRQFNRLILQQILIDQEIQESFSFLKKQRKVALDFSQGTVKVLYNVIKWFAFYQYKKTQYNSLNVKLSNSKLYNLKSAIKNETETSCFWKDFENHLSTDIKL